MLRRRRRIGSLAAVERLVGMQAQVPRDPYVALWSRLDRFGPEGLAKPIAERRALRMPLFRATLHLVTARDALVLRPVLQQALERLLYRGSPFGRLLAGVDVEELVATAASFMEERPRTRAELAPLLAARWTEHDGPSLAYAVTYLMPLVQVTPRGVWGRSGRSAFTTLEHWLGRPIHQGGDVAEVIVRYLAAFGPATVADAQTWSGLVGLGPAIERLRPRLRTFRDERGRELFDVPGAPLPDPDGPSPPRFLPEYDNVLLSHADRSRIVSDDVRPRMFRVGWGHVLVDGFVAGRWKLEREKTRATLRIETDGPLRKANQRTVSDEGERFVAFLAEDAADRDVRILRRDA